MRRGRRRARRPQIGERHDDDRPGLDAPYRVDDKTAARSRGGNELVRPELADPTDDDVLRDHLFEAVRAEQCRRIVTAVPIATDEDRRVSHQLRSS
jgi:hypothetical protein